MLDLPAPPCELFCGLTAYERRQTNEDDLGEPIYTTKYDLSILVVTAAPLHIVSISHNSLIQSIKVSKGRLPISTWRESQLREHHECQVFPLPLR